MADKSPKLLSPAAIVRLLLVVVVIPLLPLLISWHWGWWEAWVYAALAVLTFVVSRVLAARRHPDIVAERARFTEHEDTASFDKRLAPWLLLSGALIAPLAGLDERFGWSPAFSLPLKIAALLVIVAGYALSSYALIENRFFSANVRIQAERGHSVVSSGPYRWVRHPGYAGGLLSYLAMPLLLDSWWAYILVLIVIVLTVIRTALEDRTLQEQLEGYREYAGRVRYRLLPGVW